MAFMDDLVIAADSDSLADNVQSFPKLQQREIPLFSNNTVFLHIPAQCSATNEEIPVKGTLKLLHKEGQIRIQWYPSDITNSDLTCLYSHDPSDDWEDLLHDLNHSDLPGKNGDRVPAPPHPEVENNHHTSNPRAVNRRELSIPCANGDPTLSLSIKSETLRPNSRSPTKFSPGFVNIEATPVYRNGSAHNNRRSEFYLGNANSSPYSSPKTKHKSAHIFTIKKPATQADSTLDTAIAKLGDYSNIDSDAVYLECDQTNIDIKSVVVDFPIGILFSVKEVSARFDGDTKSHPAIRFNLKGSKPTQNLYFHSGKQTMMRFYSELQKHILLYRHDEDPTLLIAEPEEFIASKNRSNIDQRSYLQIASSRATDIISDNLPKLRAFVNFPFQKHPIPNTSPDKQQSRVSILPTAPPEPEVVDPDTPIAELNRSIPFMDKPNFDLMALIESVEGKTRGVPLNRDDWELFCDRDGTIKDPDTIKSIIFNGGVEDEIRPILWSFLLGYYKYSDTDIEREESIKKKENEYLIMRSQWKTMSQGQISRNKSFYKASTIISKDTIRTDREHPYFAGEGNPNLDILQDILLTHVMYDFNLGYIQGMSDILSPILIVINKEIDSFWCFVHYLDKLRDNFANTTEILKTKMNAFKDLLKFVDPPFCAFLKDNEAYGFNIFFRWLLIDFKREFNFPDLYKLWEVLWTDYLTPHYNLFIALSMILQIRHRIMEQDMSGSDFTPFDNIFRMVNDAAGDYNIDTTLLLAEALFTKMLNCSNLPPDIIHFFPTYHDIHAEDMPPMCQLDFATENIPDTNMELEELYFA